MNRFHPLPSTLLKEPRKSGILLDVWICSEMRLDLCHKLGDSSGHLEAKGTRECDKIVLALV